MAVSELFSNVICRVFLSLILVSSAFFPPFRHRFRHWPWRLSQRRTSHNQCKSLLRTTFPIFVAYGISHRPRMMPFIRLSVVPGGEIGQETGAGEGNFRSKFWIGLYRWFAPLLQTLCENMDSPKFSLNFDKKWHPATIQNEKCSCGS